MLSREMSGYGINIISVSIEDIDFADAFTDAVEAKRWRAGKLKAEIEPGAGHHGGSAAGRAQEDCRRG